VDAFYEVFYPFYYSSIDTIWTSHS